MVGADPDYRPVEHFVKPRPGAVKAGDAPLIAHLTDELAQLNAEHFAGRLPALPIHLSSYLKTTLAYLWSHDPACRCGMRRRDGTAEWFMFSRRYITTASPKDVRQLCLHELIHLWQMTKGLPGGHDELFASMARGLGLSLEFCGP